jgi:hypothetical protein
MATRTPERRSRNRLKDATPTYIFTMAVCMVAAVCVLAFVLYFAMRSLFPIEYATLLVFGASLGCAGVFVIFVNQRTIRRYTQDVHDPLRSAKGRGAAGTYADAGARGM